MIYLSPLKPSLGSAAATSHPRSEEFTMCPSLSSRFRNPLAGAVSRPPRSTHLLTDSLTDRLIDSLPGAPTNPTSNSTTTGTICAKSSRAHRKRRPTIALRQPTRLPSPKARQESQPARQEKLAPAQVNISPCARKYRPSRRAWDAPRGSMTRPDVPSWNAMNHLLDWPCSFVKMEIRTADRGRTSHRGGGSLVPTPPACRELPCANLPCVFSACADFS